LLLKLSVFMKHLLQKLKESKVQDKKNSIKWKMRLNAQINISKILNYFIKSLIFCHIFKLKYMICSDFTHQKAFSGKKLAFLKIKFLTLIIQLTHAPRKNRKLSKKSKKLNYEKKTEHVVVFYKK
jgi:hypothetical protein